MRAAGRTCALGLAIALAAACGACDARDAEQTLWLSRLFAPRDIPRDAELALRAEPFPGVQLALATFQGQDRLGLFACDHDGCDRPEARALLDFTAPPPADACDAARFDEFRATFVGFQELTFVRSPASVLRLARFEHAGARSRTVLVEYAAPEGGCALMAYSDFERSYDSAMDPGAGSLHFNGFEFTRCPRGEFCALISEFNVSCATRDCRVFVAARFPGDGDRAQPEVRLALAGPGSASAPGRAGAKVDGAGAVRYRVGEIHGVAPEDFGFEAQFRLAPSASPAALLLSVRGARFAPTLSVGRTILDPAWNERAYVFPLKQSAGP